MIPNMSTWTKSDTGGPIAGNARRAPDLETTSVVAYSRGPSAQSNVTLGLINHHWVCYQANGKIFIAKELDSGLGWGAGIEIFELVEEVLELSFTFDQNGRVQVTYLVGTGLYLRWFDPAPGKEVSYLISTIATSGLVTLDYPLSDDSTTRDVYVFYILDNGNLMYRIQRDRYVTEYIDGLNLKDKFLAAGEFTSNRRFQLKVGKIKEPTDGI